MKEKDYIYVYNTKGQKQKMELVYLFKIEKESKVYIVYKELDKRNLLYMAKMDMKNGINELDTNLTTEEEEMIVNIIKRKLLEDVYGKK